METAWKKSCFLLNELEQLLQPYLKLRKYLLCWLCIYESTWHVCTLYVKQSWDMWVRTKPQNFKLHSPDEGYLGDCQVEKPRICITLPCIMWTWRGRTSLWLSAANFSHKFPMQVLLLVLSFIWSDIHLSTERTRYADLHAWKTSPLLRGPRETEGQRHEEFPPASSLTIPYLCLGSHTYIVLFDFLGKAMPCTELRVKRVPAASTLLAFLVIHCRDRRRF